VALTIRRCRLIVELAGRIELLVNNAGVGLLGAVEASSIAQPNPFHQQHGAYHHG
jgi:short-subunit dehydrogenase